MANNNTNQVPHVLVNRVSEQAVFPSGLILSSAKTITLPHWKKTQVPTDLRFTVPMGIFLYIAPIPDLSQKSVSVSDGRIGPCTDALVWVDMFNSLGQAIELKEGDQFAQLDTCGDQIAPELIDVTPLLDYSTN